MLTRSVDISGEEPRTYGTDLTDCIIFVDRGGPDAEAYDFLRTRSRYPIIPVVAETTQEVSEWMREGYDVLAFVLGAPLYGGVDRADMVAHIKSELDAMQIRYKVPIVVLGAPKDEAIFGLSGVHHEDQDALLPTREIFPHHLSDDDFARELARARVDGAFMRAVSRKQDRHFSFGGGLSKDQYAFAQAQLVGRKTLLDLYEQNPVAGKVALALRHLGYDREQLARFALDFAHEFERFGFPQGGIQDLLYEHFGPWDFETQHPGFLQGLTDLLGNEIAGIRSWKKYRAFLKQTEGEGLFDHRGAQKAF